MATALDGLKSTPFTPSKKEKMVEEPAHPIYADAKEGPFRCDHCEHYPSPNTCDHPFIVKMRGGKVEPGACCDFMEKRKGK